jgi:hypothetical protein
MSVQAPGCSRRSGWAVALLARRVRTVSSSVGLRFVPVPLPAGEGDHAVHANRNPVDRGARPRSDQVPDPDRKEVGDDDPVHTMSRRTP